MLDIHAALTLSVWDPGETIAERKEEKQWLQKKSFWNRSNDNEL